MKIEKLIVLINILVYTHIFGLIDLRVLNISGSFSIYDYAIFINLIIITFYLLSKNKFVRKILQDRIIKISISIILFIIFVCISMPFRNGTIIDSYGIARRFFTFLLVIIIAIDTFKNRGCVFYEKLILSLGLYYSFIFIINSFNTDIFDWMQSIQSYVDDNGRFITKTNGFLLPHLAYVLILNKFFLKKNKSILLTLGILFLGILFQGFRSYLIGIIIITFIFFLLNWRRKTFIFQALIFIIAAFGVIGFSNLITSRNYITDRIQTAYYDFQEDEGSYGHRIRENEKFRRQLFINKLYLGYGFVEESSSYAKSLGVLDREGERIYIMYDFDSGFLTIGILFGLFGGAFYLQRFLAIIISLIKLVKDRQLTYKNKYIYRSCIFFILLLLMTEVSHGGLLDHYGLVPLCLILGIIPYNISLSLLSKIKYDETTYLHNISLNR